MTVTDLVTVPDCLIETTCGHPLKSGDAFYVYRNPSTWHWNPNFTGGNGDSAGIEVLCIMCHEIRARVKEERSHGV